MKEIELGGWKHLFQLPGSICIFRRIKLQERIMRADRV